MDITRETFAMMKMALILKGGYEEDLKGKPNEIIAVCKRTFGWETPEDVISGLMKLVQDCKARENILKDIKERHIFTLRDKEKGVEITTSFLKPV